MRQKLLFILILIGINGLLKAQDAIQIMQYNLLYYGNTTSYCTSTNNAVDMKNEQFKIIFNHVKPDILTVNEMAENATYQELLLTNTLNVDGVTKYKRATLTSVSQGDLLVNMLYYNSEKLTLHEHTALATGVRATDVYTLFYNAADLPWTNDTVFITCIVSHLKAGSTTSDQDQRTAQVNTIMNYIQNNDLHHNYLFMGDFNVKTASETSYTNAIKSYDGTYYLYDPMDAAGDWYTNEAYRFLHTQSPRTVSNGCASNGGLDDRFDFILASGELMDGTYGMQILPDTYHALGNDGMHFNTSILNAPENSSAPAEVVSALYNGSDHLPVLVQIQTEQSYLGLKEIDSFAEVKFQNPVQYQMDLNVVFDQATSFETRIYDLMGRVQIHISHGDKSRQHQLSIAVDNLKSGIYFLHLKTENGQESIHKFFKN